MKEDEQRKKALKKLTDSLDNEQKKLLQNFRKLDIECKIKDIGKMLQK